ncbi:ImmA/IrrE family metallo-endopeptidase [Corynebacterium mendelii]|uniref:ImmA/IrrE family metallo-endopeptidase n=1 Tax=Corynebacterium mendelii TaxID=2765362 RepID=A0A939IWW1_9CORY|nr:ImmA/IrrE family metallo-endopeptidase [Corynebacterium mendelii]
MIDGSAHGIEHEEVTVAAGPRVTVAPGILEWAVTRAGIQLHDAINEYPKLKDWLDGHRQPTIRQLEDFARRFHVPFGALFLDEPLDDDPGIPDMRTPGSTPVAAPSLDLRDTITLCRQRQSWYEEYATTQGHALPDIPRHTTDDDPVEAAEKFRLSGRLPLDPEQRARPVGRFRSELIRALQDLGILVMISGVVGNNSRRPLSKDEFRGFALSSTMAPLIFVNGKDTRNAQVFTLLNELGALLLGHSALSGGDLATDKGVLPEEQWCNAFAAQCLVPGESLRSHSDGSTASGELDALSSYYCVSSLVILIKSEATGSGKPRRVFFCVAAGSPPSGRKCPKHAVTGWRQRDCRHDTAARTPFRQRCC